MGVVVGGGSDKWQLFGFEVGGRGGSGPPGGKVEGDEGDPDQPPPQMLGGGSRSGSPSPLLGRFQK